MAAIDRQIALRALRSVGTTLSGAPPIRLVIAGGVAGLMAGVFRPARTTADCDILWTGGEEEWTRVVAAARRVAVELSLPPDWLNRDASMFAWTLPLGWSERCEPVETVGALRIERLSRIDLIATKVFSAPRRPQDLTDLRDINPTPEELDWVLRHLDRLEAEDLDRQTFDDQRAVVAGMRGAP